MKIGFDPDVPIMEQPIFRFLWARAFLLVGFLLAAVFIAEADSRFGNVYAAVTGVVCVLFVVLPPIRLAGWNIHPFFSAPAAWLAAMVAIEIALPPRCDSSDVKRRAAPIIQRLGEYQRTHGSYPPTLEAAGIPSRRYRCGTFQYRLDTDGDCYLSIGDYLLDDFEAYWNSKTGKWYLDT